MAGEELVYSYITWGRSYSLRHVSFQGTWGFKCTCELCAADEMEDHMSREAMMRDEWPGIRARILGQREGEFIDNSMEKAVKDLLGGMFGLPPRGSKQKSLDEDEFKLLCGFIEKIENTYTPRRRAVKSDLVKILTDIQEVLFQTDSKLASKVSGEPRFSHVLADTELRA